MTVSDGFTLLQGKKKKKSVHLCSILQTIALRPLTCHIYVRVVELPWQAGLSAIWIPPCRTDPVNM